MSQPELPPSVHHVLLAVAEHFQIARAALTDRNGHPHVERARQIAMYLMREIHRLSDGTIGAYVSRNHATVAHGIEIIERLIRDGDTDTKLDLEKIARALKVVLAAVPSTALALSEAQSVGVPPPADPRRRALLAVVRDELRSRVTRDTLLLKLIEKDLADGGGST